MELIVDTYQVTDNVISCDCYQVFAATIVEKEIPLKNFEKWLSDEGYLRGHYERNEPNGTYTTKKWNYNMSEFLTDGDHNYRIEELLTEFINHKTK